MSVVVDRPPADDAVGTPPGTQPRRRRAWWRYLFPWTRTAVSAPLADDDLLIVNTTDEAWALSLGYRDLGTMPPRDRQVVNVVRQGLLHARRVGAPADTAPLTLALTPSVRAVEINCVVLQGMTLYHLAAIERPRAPRRVARRASGSSQ